MPMTLTENVHEPLASIVAPDRLTLVAPAGAPIVPPTHDPDSPFGVATARPLGKLSVKLTPLSEVEPFGLVRLNVRVVVPVSGMDAAPKAFVMVGVAGRICTSCCVLGMPFVKIVARYGPTARSRRNPDQVVSARSEFVLTTKVCS